MSKKTSTENREKLSQLPTEELVEIILTQQEVIEYLKQETEKLKATQFKLDDLLFICSLQS